MIRPGADQAEREQWERDLAHGQADPDRSESDAAHDDWFLCADHWAEKAPVEHIALAYVEAPSPRERQQQRQERQARNALHPRTGNVTVQPRRVPCTCGAADRGLRLAGPAHRFSCPLHARRVNPEKEAA